MSKQVKGGLKEPLHLPLHDTHYTVSLQVWIIVFGVVGFKEFFGGLVNMFHLDILGVFGFFTSSPHYRFWISC